jgi:hypothetical protein
MSDINQENSNLNDENGEPASVEGKKKLTDTQLRIIQVIAGLVSAAALVLSMFIPSMLVQQKVIEENSLVNYLFVAVFLVVMFGRRRIENKYRLRLGLFSLTLIDGIVVGVLVYVVKVLYMPETTMANIYKVLIIVGVCVALLVLGVLLPYLKYRKRVATGTLPPIRIPEPQPKEPGDEPGEDNAEAAGPSTIEQRVAAMLREAEAPPPADETDSADEAKAEDESKPE